MAKKKKEEPQDYYYEVDDDFKGIFKEYQNQCYLPVDVVYQIVGNSKLKTMVKISKLNDLQSYLNEASVVVEVNVEELQKLDVEAQDIIINQELCKVTFDSNSGKVKLIKPDLYTFSSIVNKQGVEKVLRANQLVKLLEDPDSDSIVHTIDGPQKELFS